MKNYLALATAIFGITLATSTPSIAADAAAGKAKAAVCSGCHGSDGNSALPTNPRLAGQHADYLVQQMRDFKSSKRKNLIMEGQVKTLTDADMRDIATYYSQQQVKSGKADPKHVEAGSKLYRGGNTATQVSACIACHGPNGSGNPAAGFPSITGQHSAYVSAQLKAYRDKVRGENEGPSAMMRDIAATMTDAEIEAVSAYIQGLR